MRLFHEIEDLHKAFYLIDCVNCGYLQPFMDDRSRGIDLSVMEYTFIVEHMEEEMFEWCINEYTHMIKRVGTNIVFCNLPEDFVSNPPRAFQDSVLETRSVTDLGIPFSEICLMDSESSVCLAPLDSTDDQAKKFKYYLLGGILGNVDEFDMDRTKELRELGFPTRNLGNFQMSTDTALIVSDLILKGTKFEDLSFIDRPEIPLRDGESIVMNFRYLNENGEPLMADGIKELLLQEDDFF